MKKYIIGGLVGFMLSLGVGAHAEVINMIGKVVDGAFPVKVNGKTLANSAIVIEGTSYLPVREFGDSLGMDVKFDSTMGIELTQTATTVPTATSAPAIPTGENPKMKRYKEVVDEGSKLANEVLSLEQKVNQIKTTHATMDQNVDDLKQQVIDLKAQIDKLDQEKRDLEAEMQK